MNYRTEQEDFWAGEFGDEYISRNRSDEYLASNLALFATVLSRTECVSSIIEFGANVGMNLKAIQRLLPGADLSAVEINENAVNELKKIEGLNTHHNSILEFSPPQTYDLVIIKGVLIHTNPKELDGVYRTLYSASQRYILVAEYYNPSPVEVTYRGHEGRLFKRDFAGEMLDRFPDLKLVDYGFVYHRDTAFPLDDLTWFLLGKNQSGT